MSDRFRSGQSLDGALTAAFLNDLSTMLDQWKRSQGAAFTGATPSTGERSQTVIRVKNVSGDDVGRFAVMGLGDPVIDPGDGDAQLMSFKNIVALQGDEPDIEQHWGLFCITLTPIQDGRIGEAVVAGVVQCKVNVHNEGHTFADIEDGSTTRLSSCLDGTARILWKESGTGEKWAYVQIGTASSRNLFYNDSGATILGGSLVRFDGTHDAGGIFVPVAKQPNTFGSQFNIYVTAEIDVPDGGIGFYHKDFPCLARVNGSPTAGALMGPRSGSWQLELNTYGFKIIDQADGGLFLVERDPMLTFVGKFDSSVSKGATGTVSIYYGTSSLTDTTENMTGVRAVSGAFTTSDFVNVSKINGEWQAFLRSCG